MDENEITRGTRRGPVMAQTWTCGSCGTSNPPTSASCSKCGRW